MLVVAGALALVGAVAVLLGRVFSLEPGTVAGAYAGALTNTPALAAASARAADPAAPTIGYSITYLGGVVVMLVVAAWSLRRPGAEPRREEIGHVTVRVEVDEPMTVSMLTRAHDEEIGVSRLKHAHAANPTIVPAGTETIGLNDLVTVVGPRAALDDVAERLGHVSSHDIVEDRHDLDFRRITLSTKALVGHTVGELQLDAKFGATVSRVRRGDVDLVAHDTFVLAMGDRLRVIAPRERMPEVGAYLGDSDRGMSDINVGGLALGLAVGMAIGLVHVPTPGGGFTIGAAAGTLMVGLVFGRVGRVGPVITSMSNGAAHALSALGMVTFLAYAGVRAGRSISDALASDAGWRVAVLGLLLTACSAGLLVLGVHVLAPDVVARDRRRPRRGPDPAGDPGLRQRPDELRHPDRGGLRAGLPGRDDQQDHRRAGARRPLTEPGACGQSGEASVSSTSSQSGRAFSLRLSRMRQTNHAPKYRAVSGAAKTNIVNGSAVGVATAAKTKISTIGDPPALDEAARRHHPDGVEPDEDHGEQEADPEDEDEAGDEGEVHRRLLDVRGALRAEAVQDRQRLRQDR